jgi:hypothetical protein
MGALKNEYVCFERALGQRSEKERVSERLAKG